MVFQRGPSIGVWSVEGVIAFATVAFSALNLAAVASVVAA